MNLSTQRRLFEEIKDYFTKDTTRLAEKQMEHLGSAYFDPDVLTNERALLLTQPQLVCHSDKIKEPGDYISHDDASVPALIIRQPDGGVRAFINICRHRGARLCERSEGQSRRFVCPYHGWTYKADGSLLVAPREGFPEIDAQQDLVELPVEERHGLIWMVGTPGATINIAAHLGEVLDAELQDYPLGEFVLDREEVLEPRINWKFVLDGFLETYHFKTLHANSISPYFYSRPSPFEAYGRNSRLVGVRKIFDRIREGTFDDATGFMKHIAVNYQIFPNTVIVWQADHFEVWTSYPG